MTVRRDRVVLLVVIVTALAVDASGAAGAAGTPKVTRFALPGVDAFRVAAGATTSRVRVAAAARRPTHTY